MIYISELFSYLVLKKSPGYFTMEIAQVFIPLIKFQWLSFQYL